MYVVSQNFVKRIITWKQNKKNILQPISLTYKHLFTVQQNCIEPFHCFDAIIISIRLIILYTDIDNLIQLIISTKLIFMIQDIQGFFQYKFSDSTSSSASYRLQTNQYRVKSLENESGSRFNFMDIVMRTAWQWNAVIRSEIKLLVKETSLRQKILKYQLMTNS